MEHSLLKSLNCWDNWNLLVVENEGVVNGSQKTVGQCSLCTVGSFCIEFRHRPRQSFVLRLLEQLHNSSKGQGKMEQQWQRSHWMQQLWASFCHLQHFTLIVGIRSCEVLFGAILITFYDIWKCNLRAEVRILLQNA